MGAKKIEERSEEKERVIILPSELEKFRKTYFTAAAGTVGAGAQFCVSGWLHAIDDEYLYFAIAKNKPGTIGVDSRSSIQLMNAARKKRSDLVAKQNRRISIIECCLGIAVKESCVGIDSPPIKDLKLCKEKVDR